MTQQDSRPQTADGRAAVVETDVAFASADGVVHSRCATGMPDEYASIDHVMADDVVGDVAAWIVGTLEVNDGVGSARET